MPISLPYPVVNGTTADGTQMQANLVTLLNGANAAAALASPTFTGVPAAPTAAPGTNSAQLATTAFVQALLSNTALTGVPTAPTAAPGTNTTQIATTAFVLANAAPLASPAFTGVPTAPTAAAGTNSAQLGTTAYVDATTRPAVVTVSASFTAADTDNNTHKVASGATQTLTLGSITAGTSFTTRFTTAWALAVAGGLSKNGAAPGGVTTGSIAANSLVTFLHEGAGVWIASGSGLT